MSSRRRRIQTPTDSSSSSAASSDEDDDVEFVAGPSTSRASASSPGRRRSAAASTKGSSSSKASPFSSSSQKAALSSSPQSKVTSFNEDDVKKVVADVVFYILSQEQKRAPVKKADIFKATNLSGKPRESQDRVWNEATRKLKKVFGIELKESSKQKNTFFLINMIPEALELQHLTWSDRENARLGLLNTVLSVIFMSNGVMSDEELFKFLRRVGVYDETDGVGGSRRDRSSRGGGATPGAASHSFGAGGGMVEQDVRELFGDVKALVFKEWGQRQQYLDIVKVDSGETDNPRHEIRWGQRAQLEVKKSDLLKVVSGMYKVDPKSFKKEYDQVVKEEGEAAMAGLEEVDD